METDWNWRLQPDQGGALRAVGDIGSHWLDLTTFITGLHVESVMADLATFITARHQPTGPVETFSTERATDTVETPISTEDAANILVRYEGGARGIVAISQISPGRKNSLQYEIDGSAGATAWDSETAGSALDRPPRQAQRDPDQEPGTDVRRRSPGSGTPRAATSRALPTPSPRCSALSTPTSARVAWTPTLSTPRSVTATRRCSSAMPLRRARARAPGSGDRGVRPHNPAGGTFVRLGFLTAPLPDMELDGHRRLGGGGGVRLDRDRVLAAVGPGPARRYAGTSHIDVANLSDGQAQGDHQRDQRQGHSRSRASASTRTRSTPIRPCATRPSPTSRP